MIILNAIYQASPFGVWAIQSSSQAVIDETMRSAGGIEAMFWDKNLHLPPDSKTLKLYYNPIELK